MYFALLSTQKIYKKGEVDTIAHSPLTRLRGFMPETTQSKSHWPLIVSHCVRSRKRIRKGGVYVRRWKGERPGAVSRYFSFNPGIRTAVYFLILYRKLVRSTSVPPPFATRPEGHPNFKRAHRNTQRCTCTRRGVSQLSCLVLPRVDYCRLSPRSTGTSATTPTPPVKHYPWQHLCHTTPPFAQCPRTV